MTGTQETIDGRPALRFERRLPHAHRARLARGQRAGRARPLVRRRRVAWIPEEGETFEAAGDTGRVTVVDPPNTLAWQWGAERYRFELTPHADGTTLVFTHVFNGALGPDWQHAAGWETYFNRLDAHLAGGHLTEEDAHEDIDALHGALPRGVRGLEQRRQRRAGVLGDVEQRLGIDADRHRRDRAHDRDERDRRPAPTPPRGASITPSASCDPPAIAGRAPGAPSARGRARLLGLATATPRRPRAGSTRARAPSRARSRRRGTRTRCRPPPRSGRSSRRSPPSPGSRRARASRSSSATPATAGRRPARCSARRSSP